MPTGGRRAKFSFTKLSADWRQQIGLTKVQRQMNQTISKPKRLLWLTLVLLLLNYCIIIIINDNIIIILLLYYHYHYGYGYNYDLRIYDYDYDYDYCLHVLCSWRNRESNRPKSFFTLGTKDPIGLLDNISNPNLNLKTDQPIRI